MKVGIAEASRNHEAGGIGGLRAADWLSGDCGDAAAGDTDIGDRVVHRLGGRSPPTIEDHQIVAIGCDSCLRCGICLSQDGLTPWDHRAESEGE